MEEIHVVVLAYEPRSRDDVLGEIIIPVSRLKDQYRHDELFDLHDISGHPVSGKIHLSLQWIHSRVKYLNDVVRKWDDHIRSQIEDKADFERDLATLYEPFKGLVNLRNKTSQVRQPQQPLRNDFSALERGGGSVEPQPVKRVAAISFSNISDKTWFDYCYYGTLIYLTLAFLACFGRNTFLDVRILVLNDITAIILIDLYRLAFYLKLRHSLKRIWRSYCSLGRNRSLCGSRYFLA